jgi:hypothetical protein
LGNKNPPHTLKTMLLALSLPVQPYVVGLSHDSRRIPFVEMLVTVNIASRVISAWSSSVVFLLPLNEID